MNDKSISKKVQLLGGILALQLGVIGVLYWHDGGEETVTSKPLLAMERDNVDHLEIVAEDKTLNLRKENDRWVLADGLPADGVKVDNLLNNLGELRAGWPVASSRAAHERFQVSEENAQRRINVFSDDKAVGSLLLGTAPSFKRVHIRNAVDDDVYAVSFDAFEVVADADRWLDTAVVRPAGEIHSIASADFKVSKADGKWPAEAAQSAGPGLAQDVSSPAADAQKPAPDAPAAEPDAVQSAAGAETATADAPAAQFDAQAFAAAVKDLRVLGLAGNLAELDAPDKKEGANDDKKSLVRFSVTVSTDQGEYIYELLNKDTGYYIRRNDYEQTFRVSKSLYDEFAKVRDMAEQSNS